MVVMVQLILEWWRQQRWMMRQIPLDIYYVQFNIVFGLVLLELELGLEAPGRQTEGAADINITYPQAQVRARTGGVSFVKTICSWLWNGKKAASSFYPSISLFTWTFNLFPSWL